MTKLILLALVVAVIVAVRVEPQETRVEVGDRFPMLRGQFLTGSDAALPEASSGVTRPVAIGFTYESRFPVEAWADWYSTAIGPRTDVTFFEAPMISGWATLGQWFIDRGMRNGTPVALHENVITVYGGAGAWKDALGYGPGYENDAYLVVLDGDGVVQWRYHGMFDDATAGRLRDVIVSLADRDVETRHTTDHPTNDMAGSR
ncbi:MAG: hypothetical protein O2930_09125 [Acidobacteria bacterium]|nr:hypothetical protein [Acidobacteriota bacterium]